MNNNCSKKQYNIDIEKDKNNNKEQTLMPIMNYSFWILFGFFGIFYILFTKRLSWQHKKIIILSILIISFGTYAIGYTIGFIITSLFI